jgi:hypothetical protein
MSICGGRLESLRGFRSTDSICCVDSGRPPRITLSIRIGSQGLRRPTRTVAPIQVGRLESLCRFTSADANRCVDSGLPARMSVSIRAGRHESLCRFKPAGSIHADRLEPLRRIRSADSDRCVDSHRPTRIDASIQVGGPAASNRRGDSGRPSRCRPPRIDMSCRLASRGRYWSALAVSYI